MSANQRMKLTWAAILVSRGMKVLQAARQLSRTSCGWLSAFREELLKMKVQWDEPVEFIRAYLQSIDAMPTRRGRVWAAIITAVVVDGLVLAFWGFFYLLHKKDLGVPTYTYFVAPAIAGVFVYFLPVMINSSRCVIVLTEKGIHRNKNLGTAISMQLWPWDSITELAVEEVRFGETVHRVLVVHSSLEQGDILLGLGETPLEPIEDAITQMGKTMVYR